MTDQGSPGTGASMTTNGFVIPRDRAKHRAELETITWETATRDPMTLQATHVRELSPTAGDEPEDERTFTSEELEALPEFLRDSFEPEPENVPEPTRQRPSKGVPRKLLYGEILASGRTDLTDTERLLLFAMWRYADNTTLGDVFPGHAALAEAVGLSGKSGRDKIRTRIKSLVRKGYAVVVSEGRSVPTKRAAVYRLTLPEWEAPSS